ncbi:hypothetical protein [Ramlibacter sp. PS4R-6]|uniref:hypothetical protein n=1 Tax=Ramlibacter sp. PS4R-6 TaxID=3133438 RepID=UPI0030A87B17
MMHRLLVLGLAFAATGSLAQSPAALGKVAEVEGVVTVSDGATLTTAKPGTVIQSGDRFLTASSGAARLTFENGCVVSLKPNETLTVSSNMTCQELLAAVQPVAAVAGVTSNTLLLVGAAGTAAAVAGRQGNSSGIAAAPISSQ